jgi:hypothetical protein
VNSKAVINFYESKKPIAKSQRQQQKANANSKKPTPTAKSQRQQQETNYQHLI